MRSSQRGVTEPTAHLPAAAQEMEYITLPGTDLKVLRICLGTMQFSDSWEWPMEQAVRAQTVPWQLAAAPPNKKACTRASARGMIEPRPPAKARATRCAGTKHGVVPAHHATPTAGPATSCLRYWR